MVAKLCALQLAMLVTGALCQSAFLRTMPRVLAATDDPVHALLRQNMVIPEVLDDFVPTVNITMSFGGKEYPIGAQIAPADAKAAPTLTYTGLKTGTQYTIVMTDPRCPTRHSCRKRVWLHYIAVNGPEAATTVMTYSGPNPPKGNHRYVIIMFEQTGAITPATPTERGGFSTRAFAATNGLKPVGATFFMSENPAV